MFSPYSPKRTVTIPHVAGSWGFKLTGGNAVGLFISEVAAGRDEIKVGDQVHMHNCLILIHILYSIYMHRIYIIIMYALLLNLPLCT